MMWRERGFVWRFAAMWRERGFVWRFVAFVRAIKGSDSGRLALSGGLYVQ